MKIETQLFEECKSKGLNCSLTHQSITDYSVEVYKGFNTTYQKIFYTDGHISRSVAIRKALKFIRAL